MLDCASGGNFACAANEGVSVGTSRAGRRSYRSGPGAAVKGGEGNCDFSRVCYRQVDIELGRWQPVREGEEWILGPGFAFGYTR